MYRVEMYGDVVLKDEGGETILHFNSNLVYYDKEKQIITAYNNNFKLILYGVITKKYEFEGEQYTTYYCKNFVVFKDGKEILRGVM